MGRQDAGFPAAQRRRAGEGAWRKQDRYSRQTIFPGIGPEGQRRLGAGFAVVVGCGALGTVISSALVRAGVGRVRVIDRDFIEYHNLQRQVLFTERDIEENLPKAVAAERHLREANSAVEVEGVVADFSRTNAEKLVEGADVIVDGLDNFETRFLINDVALKLRHPLGVRRGHRVHRHDRHLPAGRTPLLPLSGQLAARRGHADLRHRRRGQRRPLDRRVAGGGRGAQDPHRRRAAAPVSRDLVVFDVWQRSFESLPLAGFAERGLPRLRRHLRIPGGQAAHPGHQPLRPERRPDLEHGRRGHAAGRRSRSG